jgi:hypothetical protein
MKEVAEVKQELSNLKHLIGVMEKRQTILEQTLNLVA